jgi:SAM-dependent methyltransferase
MVTSPWTGSTNVKPIARYSPSVISDGNASPGVSDNYLCLDSGLLFNAAGTRGRETGFYQDDYDLHSESVEAEFVYFDSGKAIGLYDNILNFIRDGVKLGATGRALDIGCGKGMLLNRFQHHFENWSLAAVEPSKNATRFFAKVMPKLQVFEGPFEASPFAREQFDFVMANGVLEHVPSPVAFMKSFASCMRPGGYGFIGVPNLVSNPADLLTLDHLSKLTPNVTREIFRSSGLRVVAETVPTTRVPMWFVVQLDEAAAGRPVQVRVEEELQIAERSNDYIKKSFASCDAAVAAARADGRKIAVYGTGLIALGALNHTSLAKKDVLCIYDDNPSLWGQERWGISVRNPEELATSTEVGHVVISANPCYYQAIEKRIRALAPGRAIAIYRAEGHG